MKFRHLLPLLFAALFFAGCATSLSPADKARIHRVGVVSLVSDSVRGSFVGLTVFNNQCYDAPAPDFAIDQILEQETARAFGTGSIALSMEREAIRTASQYTQFFSCLPPYDTTRAAEVKRNIAAKHRLDAIAIWTPRVFEEHGLRLRGSTISSAVFGGGKLNVGVCAQMGLFDGQTGRQLGATTGATSINPIAARWRKNFADFTSEERAELRNEFQRQSREKAASAPTLLGIAR